MDKFCCYCGRSLSKLPRDIISTKEHLIPVSKGGSNYHVNLWPCCSEMQWRKR